MLLQSQLFISTIIIKIVKIIVPLTLVFREEHWHDNIPSYLGTIIGSIDN